LNPSAIKTKNMTVPLLSAPTEVFVTPLHYRKMSPVADMNCDSNNNHSTTDVSVRRSK
jgi:hypothetical protein